MRTNFIDFDQHKLAIQFRILRIEDYWVGLDWIGLVYFLVVPSICYH